VHDSLVGLIRPDTGPAGNAIWRASSGDVQGWSDSRNGAIAKVIDLYNMQEKARAYDLIVPRLEATA
jgi:hypothetical protein